jgi:pentapeptide repeat protein
MLASRLGVALLIILGITTYVANRPMVSAHVGDTKVAIVHDKDSADLADTTGEGTRIRIGPLSIDADPEMTASVRDSLEALEDSEILNSEELEIIKQGFMLEEIQKRHLKAESEAIRSAGREIAKEFAAKSPEPKDNQPDRLSEEEIQSLVVERLLSVQSQMRSEDPGASDTPSAEPGAPNTADPVPGLEDVSTGAPSAPIHDTPVAAPPEGAPEGLVRIEADFAGKNLMGTDFRNRDLSGLDFSNAKLTAAKFDGSDLSGANLSGARIQGASFVGALMVDALLNNAQAQTANFHHANLIGADLSQANFAGAVLTQADMRGVKMTDINLNGAIMDGTKMDDKP